MKTDSQPLQLIFAAVEDSLADAWELFCGDLPFVTVHRGSILEVECDAVVSPANSFGFMDGGIDMFYSQCFGWGVQERLQRAIQTHHYGELLVGAAEIVETAHAKIPYLIAAPTMRVPMILRDSVNPYLAARAVLLLIRHGIFSEGTHVGKPIADFVKTVAFPGLGTGVGQVGPITCANQMREAINTVILENVSFPTSWADASAQHVEMHQGLPFRNLQHG